MKLTHILFTTAVTAAITAGSIWAGLVGGPAGVGHVVTALSTLLLVINAAAIAGIYYGPPSILAWVGLQKPAPSAMYWPWACADLVAVAALWWGGWMWGGFALLLGLLASLAIRCVASMVRNEFTESQLSAVAKDAS